MRPPQAGRLQTLLRTVDGLVARCSTSSSSHPITLPLPLGPPAIPPLASAPASRLITANPNPSAAAASCQLAALGVAAAWRLGAWQLLRSYLSVLESCGGPGEAGGLGAGAGGRGGSWGAAAALGAGDQWEVAVGAILEAMQRGAADEVRLVGGCGGWWGVVGGSDL